MVPLRCVSRTHAVVLDGRFLKMRCTDRACPDVRQAKADGVIAFHVFDLESRAQWTEFEPKRNKE